MINKEFKRNCPICNKAIVYTKSSNFCAAKKDNLPCKKCNRKTEKKWIRVCPKCKKEVKHSSRRSCNDSIKNGKLCISCSIIKEKPLFRFCPQCNIKINYTNKHACSQAEKSFRLCKKCGNKKAGLNRAGEKNFFFKKKHTIETKKKMSQKASDRNYTEEQKCQAKEQLKKVTNKKPLYDIWTEKYGKEIAEQKLVAFKKKQSENNSGNRNSMYGKPSPQGSGNGWSGWYKDWFFRSLRELSYMINVIEKQNLQWCLPNKDFIIKYKDYLGNMRNYYPDFIVERKKMIEIKPIKLHNTPKVLAKCAAAVSFCEKNNMIFEIIDPVILSEDDIKKLYITGQVKFLDKYDKKFKQRYLK